MKKTISAFQTGLAITLLVLLLSVNEKHFPLFKDLENTVYDLRFNIRGEIPHSEDIVVIGIDDKSLSEVGHWTWPRSVFAEMISILEGGEAKLIAFDIFFGKKGSSNEKNTLDRLKEQFTEYQLRDLNENASRFYRDMQLAQIMADQDAPLIELTGDWGNVLHAYYFSFVKREGLKIDLSVNREKTEILKQFSFTPFIQNKENLEYFPFARAVDTALPIKDLMSASSLLGFVNIVSDDDGSLRWENLLIEYENELFPSLSLLAAAMYLEAESIAVNPGDGVYLDNTRIPMDPSGRLLINYYGPGFDFDYYSFSDVLLGRVKPEVFKDKLVLIGGTAPILSDYIVTPVSSHFPGVEKHATVISNILQQNFYIKSQWTEYVNIASILFLGLFLSFLLPRISILSRFLCVFTLMAFYFVLLQYFFEAKGLWFQTVFPFLEVLLVYTGITLHLFIVTEKVRKFTQKAFSKYLSSVVVEELLQNPELLKSGGDERVMSVMFSDMVGFTSMSERMTYPELAKHMNEYFTEMTQIVHEEKGTVTQYAGDLVMAIYGAPVPLEDHAHNAVSVAVKMRNRLRELNKKWSKRGLPELGVRTGVNTDRMFFGNLGSQQIYYYSVMGDSVNTAARLESANKQYGTNIMISENTFCGLKDGVFRTRLLDIIQVKGKSKAVKVYDVYGETSVEMREEELAYYVLYEEGFAFYLDREFEKALEKFEAALARKDKDLAAQRMKERCLSLASTTLSDDWDGVYVMTTK